MTPDPGFHHRLGLFIYTGHFINLFVRHLRVEIFGTQETIEGENTLEVVFGQSVVALFFKFNFQADWEDERTE